MSATVSSLSCVVILRRSINYPSTAYYFNSVFSWERIILLRFPAYCKLLLEDFVPFCFCLNQCRERCFLKLTSICVSQSSPTSKEYVKMFILFIQNLHFVKYSLAIAIFIYIYFSSEYIKVLIYLLIMYDFKIAIFTLQRIFINFHYILAYLIKEVLLVKLLSFFLRLFNVKFS